ncbi:hypothetical protein GOP47_0008821 [Adiantum capillus-veneris]|uniref:Uncharacterized protein n=1 Tax=Adiantum capillus-veneris TaxID=13818 RepID=A0A9D4UZ28_ADICA|nr:hypothetical protein GOP47_0008821 [Adiantum capillus-veneris]
MERVVMDMQGPFFGQYLMSDYLGYYVDLLSSSIVHPSAFPNYTPSNITFNSAPLHSFNLLASDAPLRSG